MTKNKKIGIALLASPWVLMILAYSLFFISRTIPASYEPPPQLSESISMYPGDTPPLQSLVIAEQQDTTANLLRVIASLLGTLGVILIFVGTILGIYFMAKADDQKNSLIKNPPKA